MRLILAALVAVFSYPAFAQPVCDKRAEVTSHLEQQYSEKSVAIGLANNGSVIEVLTSEKGNTWTIIVTLPNGKTCLLAAGESWEAIKPKFGKPL